MFDANGFRRSARLFLFPYSGNVLAGVNEALTRAQPASGTQVGLTLAFEGDWRGVDGSASHAPAAVIVHDAEPRLTGARRSAR